MPRRRSGKPHVNLADLVLRKLRQQTQALRHQSLRLRSHPYNLRKSTLQRVPGSMNETVLWKKQLSGSNRSARAQAVRSSSTMTSGSRLYLAEVDIPKDGLKASDPSDPACTTGTQTQCHQSATPLGVMSTVVLHRNPHFDVDGKRRSGLLSVKKRLVVRLSKHLEIPVSPKKQKVESGSDGSSISSGAASGSTATENSKTETEESNSFDGNVDNAEAGKGVVSAASAAIAKNGQTLSAERKDQELAPPPPPPTLPHVQHACSTECLTLAQILESVDNYMNTVPKGC